MYGSSSFIPAGPSLAHSTSHTAMRKVNIPADHIVCRIQVWAMPAVLCGVQEASYGARRSELGQKCPTCRSQLRETRGALSSVLHLLVLTKELCHERHVSVDVCLQEVCQRLNVGNYPTVTMMKPQENTEDRYQVFALSPSPFSPHTRHHKHVHNHSRITHSHSYCAPQCTPNYIMH